MQTDFSIERKRLIILWIVFMINSILISIVPPNISGPWKDNLIQISLFIPGGLVVMVVASLILSPHLLNYVLSAKVSHSKARIAVVCGIIFVILCIVSEWFFLWPKAYRQLYFDGLPLSLGFCFSSILVGLRAMRNLSKVEVETPILWGSLSPAISAFVSVFFILSSNFTYSHLWIVVPAFVCLFYSVKVSVDVALALLYLKGE